MDESEILPCADKLVFDSEKEAKDQARVIKWRRAACYEPINAVIASCGTYLAILKPRALYN